MDQQKKSRADVNSLPTRQYLDQTINPILLPALKCKRKLNLPLLENIRGKSSNPYQLTILIVFFLALAKERPADPIGFLIAHLTKYKTKMDES